MMRAFDVLREGLCVLASRLARFHPSEASSCDTGYALGTTT